MNRLTNLKCVSKGNKSEIMTAIESLRDNGGTNVALGMEHAFKCIKERKFRNQVTSVFLLSDGLDGGAETRVMQALSRASLEDTFTINTFGFGSDHDPKLMTEISKLKDGNFYFIEKLDKIDECFADALGALFSIVAQDVKISMTVKRAAPFTDH